MQERQTVEYALNRFIVSNRYAKFTEKINEIKIDLNKIYINPSERVTLIHFLGNLFIK